jgi:serine/threonine protein phosphatase 1
MIDKFLQMFRPRAEAPTSAIPPGERVYAIGDIHGRLDLLTKVARAIEEDDDARGEADTTIILLGDLIDRGPDSAAVIDMARAWKRRRNVRILAGNHEEMFLLAFYKLNAFKNFLRIGGRETVLSYDIDIDEFRAADLERAQQMMIDAVPLDHREFLHDFESAIRIGDYLFVHAGINPERPLADQKKHDLRWIREPFLSHKNDYGCVVVHGHTVTDDVVIRPNRIGLDTGAFMTGKLTALGLEGTERWLIEAQEDGGAIETFARAA